MNKFRTKKGELSLYAFRCGYLQQIRDNNINFYMCWDSTCWKVFAYDHSEHNRLFWECFDNLTEARKFFWSKKQELFGNKHYKF